MAYENIQFHIENGIAQLTLNRPDKLNSFTQAMHLEVRAALEQVAHDASVRVLVLTGAGRGFCAGQDLGDRAVEPGAQGVDLGESVEKFYAPLVLTLRNLPMPVICAVNGVAAGAGANLALACDIVIAAKSASFVEVFCKLGLIPDTGGTWILPRLIGHARATGLAMLGEKLTAERAEQWGLIWKCVPDEELMKEALAMATHFSTAPTKGLAFTKRALQASYTNTLPEQLKLEGEMMRELGYSHDYREGVAAFIAKRPAQFKGEMTMTPLAAGSTVAVIGSGAMGAGIAQVAAVAGHTVRLYDARPEAVAKAIADIGKVFGKLVEKGRMSGEEAAGANARLHAAASLHDVRDAALVVEAIVEDLAAKRALFAELETIVGDDCILATNTSSISVTAIAARLRAPQRLVGMHFFNPVPLMALVEVISGLATSQAVADAVYATAAAWGKNPVHAKSTPGFIVNRVARPFYGEALRLLNEQAADPATLDALMREAGGFRMGPFELMDLIGHDINFSVTQSVFQAYFGDPRFTPSVLQQEMVNAGFLGRKSGRGFYDYADGAVNAAPRTEAPQPKPNVVGYSLEAGADAKLTGQMEQRLIKAGYKVAHRGALPGAHEKEAPAFHCNGAAIFLTDGRSATERANHNNHPDTVLFDLAFDYASAPRIALACSDQCAPEAYRSAVGLFQAAGFAVSRIDDVPGMVVMRTVAMLANEAADVVNQGVCSAQAVDIAMQKGVNYPRGPLAWVDAAGAAQLVQVLSNLAATYGEDRYRVSPLLRRKVANKGRFHAA